MIGLLAVLVRARPGVCVYVCFCVCVCALDRLEYHKVKQTKIKETRDYI